MTKTSSMDFSQFDNRAVAERGAKLQLKHPDTREPLTNNGQPCLVTVRGAISKPVQTSIRQKLKEQVVSDNKVIVGETPESKALRKAKIRVMEDVHNETVESTLPFMVAVENVARGGELLQNTEDDFRWLLNLTFPVIKPELDAEGKPIFDDGVDEEGKPTKMPRLMVVNLPFTKQIQDFASELGTSLGNDSTT